MKKFLACIFCFLTVTSAFAANKNPSAALIERSRQLIVVTTSDWNAVDGKLQRYERKNPKHLRQVPQYLWGMAVNYNQPHPVVGSGSCVFMHIWKGPGTGTAGCVAIPEPDVESLITWLNPVKKPLIVILPHDEYHALTRSWELPAKA